MLTASPTPSKAQVVLAAEDSKPWAHRGLGAPFATPPHLRNAEMRNPMPYKHATSLTALLAGILKSGSRYGCQAYDRKNPVFH